MTYVISDLHGVELRMLQQMLKEAGFGEDDVLFVLGDTIDRGKYGIELLLWMMNQCNIFHLLGNHEAMLRSTFDAFFEEVTEENLEDIMTEKMGIISTMLVNGAQPTLTALRKLSRETPEMAELLKEYLQEMPLYDIVEVEDTTYILVHAGLGDHKPGKKLSAYTPEDLLWHRPELTEQYETGGNTHIIFGHTPTSYYGKPGQIVRTPTRTCIDTSDTTPHLIRLDDWKVFKKQLQ